MFISFSLLKLLALVKDSFHLHTAKFQTQLYCFRHSFWNLIHKFDFIIALYSKLSFVLSNYCQGDCSFQCIHFMHSFIIIASYSFHSLLHLIQNLHLHFVATLKEEVFIEPFHIINQFHFILLNFQVLVSVHLNHHFGYFLRKLQIVGDHLKIPSVLVKVSICHLFLHP